MGQEYGFLAAEKESACDEFLIRPNDKITPIEELKKNDAKDKEEELKEDEGETECQVCDDGLSQEMATEDEGEEGRTPVELKTPLKVSKAEREEHELTHCGFRAWCKYCVKGRGKNMAHHRSDKDKAEAGVPRISMDYFFMSKKDVKANENPLIVMTDEGTGEKYARAVGQKGLGSEGEMDWMIKDMSTELKVWGHPGGEGGNIILKSDSENAIIAVRDALSKYHGGRVVPESPAKNESQSNGTAEEAGKTVREFTRVLKEQLEDQADMTIKPGDVITLWMVR